MKAYTTLLFDLDDTLLDFVESENRGLNYIYHKYCKDFGIQLQQMTEAYHPINKKMWASVDSGARTPTQIALLRFEELFNELNLNHDAVEASVAYETAISEEAHWIPGAEQSIKELQDSYRIGVITNGLRVAQIRKAEKMNLHSWSDCYLISEIEGIAKPNPEIFQRALQSLNCDKKDCLMIGDNLKSDFQGAKNAGIDFCWIDTRNTLSSLSPNDEKPEWRLNSVAQLPDFLQSMYAENIN